MLRSGQIIAAVLVIPIALSAAPRSAPAQYMYLDTNGDGVHSDADVIAPAGPTTLGIWIRTDADRDGTPATCVSGPEPITIVTYEVVLHAVDGTVRWGAYTNVPPSLPPAGQRSDSIDFVSGLYGPPTADAGLRRLGSLTLEVASGTPSIVIVPSAGLDPRQETAFGTGCDGPRGDNSMALGRDWLDTDGARYGGWTNPPMLAQPASMTVAENSTADQGLSATDPEGSPITFSKVLGPDYMTVVPYASNPSLWRIHLAPGFSDAGGAVGWVAASDGVGKDIRAVGIEVLNTNRAPEFELLPSPCVEQGQTRTFYIRAADPDNDAITFTEEGAPSFLEFLGSWMGVLPLVVAPTADDEPGSTTVRITATDGAAPVTREIVVKVAKLGGCSGRPPLFARVSPNPMRISGTLVFWTSMPGPLRVTLHDTRGRVVRTLLQEANAAAAYHQVPVGLGYRYDGSRLPAGVYFYRIQAAEGAASGRLTVLR